MHLISKLKMLSDRLYLKLAIFWTLLTLWLSLISARNVSRFNVWDFVGFDKLAHLTFYAIFTVLWLLALRTKNINQKFVFFYSVSFGVLMEICQFWLFNGRSFELYDILANIVGSIVGFVSFKKFIN
ncbi:MAG: VanZ family protein [Saprospiraceae bacterium]|nr:VanZ family protein [Saprospiraceae bacterium]